VLVEAAVLDRNGGLLHIGGDVARLDQDPLVVVEESPDLVALVVDHDRVLGLRELLLVLELRQVLGNRHHHPEEGGDDRQHPEADDQDQQAELLDAAGLGLAGPPRADSPRKTRWRGLAGAIGRAGLRDSGGDALAEGVNPVAALGDSLTAHPAQALEAAADGAPDLGAAPCHSALLRLALQNRLEVGLFLPFRGALEALPLLL
jgi:hypothetical protein